MRPASDKHLSRGPVPPCGPTQSSLEALLFSSNNQAVHDSKAAVRAGRVSRASLLVFPSLSRYRK